MEIKLSHVHVFGWIKTVRERGSRILEMVQVVYSCHLLKIWKKFLKFKTWWPETLNGPRMDGGPTTY
jgi:hypothetical protein